MNDKLLNLYKSKWENLCNAIQPVLSDSNLNIKPTCPLLLSIDDEEEYQSADIRLMIFGKETYNWFEEFNPNIDSVIERYNEYFNSGDWKLDTKRIFWRGVKNFIKSLQEKYSNKKINFIWNNIVKIGKHEEKGFPPNYIYGIERKYFSVIKEELKILKPDIVLFLTGPDYDDIIRDNIGELLFSSISNLPERELAKIEIVGIPFVFRTYHPQGSMFFGKEYNVKCFKSLLDNIDFKKKKND